MMPNNDNRRALENGVIIKNNDRSIIIDNEVARGGFSIVYKAHYNDTHEYILLKELFPIGFERKNRGDKRKIQ